MSNHLTPVEVCERLIGPLPELERIGGYMPKAGYGWLRSSKDRAPGDFPTARLMRALLDHSEAQGLGLTASHLIRGADEAEVDEILSTRAAPPPAFTTRRRGGARMEAAE